MLKRHPGDSGVFRTPVDDLAAYDTFAASSVVHYFRVDRPGQLRGIPDITPALPLFAQLRRYTLATIAAAETATVGVQKRKARRGAEYACDGQSAMAFDTEGRWQNGATESLLGRVTLLAC